MYRFIASTWSRLALLGGYAFFIWLTAFSAYRSPAWNFDAIPYMGVALARQESNEVTLHGRVYDTFARIAPVEVFDGLVRASSYREALFTSPKAFAALLPLYANRPAYTSLVSLAGTDQDTARATYLVSSCGYLLLAIVLLTWTLQRASLVAGVLIALGTMLSPPFIEGARLSTPDMTCAFALSLGSLVALEFRQTTWSSVPLAFACLTRPDAVFACLLVILLGTPSDDALSSRLRKHWAPCLLVLGAALFAGTRGYPWGTVMQHTFVRRIQTAGDATQTISVADYARCVARGLTGSGALGASILPLEGVLSIAVWKRTEGAMPRRLLGIAWAAIGLHYLLFPMLADRFFLQSYVLIAVACASASEKPFLPPLPSR